MSDADAANGAGDSAAAAAAPKGERVDDDFRRLFVVHAFLISKSILFEQFLCILGYQ